MGNSSRRSSLLGCWALAATLAACAQPRLLTPQEPTQIPRTRGFYPGGIKVGRVSLQLKGIASEADAKKVRDAFARDVERAFPRQDPALEPIEADLNLEIWYTRHRAIFPDILAVETFGLWPLTPAWGKAMARLDLRLTMPETLRLIQPITLSRTAQTRHSTLFYSWFRSGPLDRALARVAPMTLPTMGQRLESWWYTPDASRYGSWTMPQRWISPKATVVPRKGWTMFEFGRDGELTGVFANPGWQLITDDAFYGLPPAGKNKLEVAKNQRQRSPSLWRSYLGALSGLEVGYFRGSAWVDSQATSSTGDAFTIASGNATSKGWKINFFSPPTKSEVFLYPTLGFFSLDIDIADVAGDIPLGRVADATDMPAVGTDPNTGEPIDLGAPNQYALRLRSGFLGQRLVATAVWGNQDTQLFLTGQGGLNLFEWRYTDVSLGRYEESAHSAKFFHSYALRGLVGITHRPWHVAGRCEANFEFYREFEFPRAIPFEGRVEYNSELKTYQRQEIKVDAAQVNSVNLYCGVSFVY